MIQVSPEIRLYLGPKKCRKARRIPCPAHANSMTINLSTKEKHYHAYTCIAVSIKRHSFDCRLCLSLYKINKNTSYVYAFLDNDFVDFRLLFCSS